VKIDPELLDLLFDYIDARIDDKTGESLQDRVRVRQIREDIESLNREEANEPHRS
jgi:hypothetical protein